MFNTISYGRIRLVKESEIVRPYDETIECLFPDCVEVIRLASGEVVGVDYSNEE